MTQSLAEELAKRHFLDEGMMQLGLAAINETIERCAKEVEKYLADYEKDGGHDQMLGFDVAKIAKCIRALKANPSA